MRYFEILLIEIEYYLSLPHIPDTNQLISYDDLHIQKQIRVPATLHVLFETSFQFLNQLQPGFFLLSTHF